MVWRNRHRAGHRKRERIITLQKQPKITAIKTGDFISDHAKQQLRRAAWRARHADLSDNQNIEIIDLTRDIEETSNDNIEQTESTQTIYTTTITKLFTKIEQHLLTIGYMKENPDLQLN